MPTQTQDLKAYWSELARKAGIAEDKANAISEALGDETVQKAFREGFRPMPDYSRDMDKVRDETTAKVAEGIKSYYDNWYQREALPVLERKGKEADAARAALQRYREAYGELDDGSNGQKVVTPAGDYLSKAEFDDYMRRRD